MQTTIREIDVYRDSVACCFTASPDSLYTARRLFFEDGTWKNAGEALSEANLSRARQKFLAQAPADLQTVRRVAEVGKVSTDTLAFVDYLKSYAVSPEKLVLNAVKTHKLTVYGEMHVRQVSWNLLRKVIAYQQFTDNVGTIFLEISVDAQPYFDKFFADNKLHPDILLDCFRNEDIYGWYDKGMFEFLCAVWRMNSTLAPAKRIRVIATDIPRPFYHHIPNQTAYRLFTENGRNEQMAESVDARFSWPTDPRNALFIVGQAHAYKSAAQGYGEHSLVWRLIADFGWQRDDIYAICQHSPLMTNSGVQLGELRHGLFDAVFKRYGKTPFAFELKDSLFGAEPCDISAEMTCDPACGSYRNNYDGYIYWQDLRSEPAEYRLDELYDAAYLKEIQRRATIVGDKELFGVPIDSLSVNAYERWSRAYGAKPRWGI